MRLAGTIFFTVAVCAWSTVMFAWVDQRQRVARQRSITAQAALRRRIDRELAAIRAGIVEELDRLWGHVHEDEPNEPELDDLAWQPDPAPATQPITLPAPAGPATEPAVEVASRQVRELMQLSTAGPSRATETAAWVDAELKKFDFSGRRR